MERYAVSIMRSGVLNCRLIAPLIFARFSNKTIQNNSKQLADTMENIARALGKIARRVK